tara:strand:+ start:5129 stop:5851 length:723 start_codon:yes stop_codon:yes gene_type:complete
MKIYYKNLLFISSILFLLFLIIQFVDKTCFRLRENMTDVDAEEATLEENTEGGDPSTEEATVEESTEGGDPSTEEATLEESTEGGGPSTEEETVPEETTGTLISQSRFYSDVSEDMDYCNSLKLMQVFIKNPQGEPDEKETIYDGLTNSTSVFNLPCNDTGVRNNYCDGIYYLGKYANKHPWMIGIDVNDSNNKNIKIDDVKLTTGKLVSDGSNKQIQWDIPVNPSNDKKCNFKYGFNII